MSTKPRNNAGGTYTPAPEPESSGQTKALWSVFKTKPADEKARLARRKEIKAEVAKIEATRAKATAMMGHIRELDKRADRADEKHSATTEPIQARLSEIDVLFEQALLAGRELDPALVHERDGLLHEISDANLILETEAQAIEKLRIATEKQRQQLIRDSTALDKVRSQLRNPGIANPKLLNALTIARNSVEWSKKRVMAAHQTLERVTGAQTDAQRQVDQIVAGREEYDLEGNPTLPDDWNTHMRKYAGAVAECQLELEAAVGFETAAMNELTRLRQQIIDE